MEKIVLTDPKNPHMDQSQIVFKLIELQSAIESIQKNPSGGQDYTAVIDGLSQQVNYLQDKVKELEANCVKVDDLGDVGTTGDNSSGPGTSDSNTNPFNSETPTP